MLGDVNIAEPKALIGFAGPRVIEQTIRQKLPEGFQRSEFLLEHGMLDLVVDRRELKAAIARVLRFGVPAAAPAHAPPTARSAAAVAAAVEPVRPSPRRRRRADPLEFLFSLERFGMKFGLDEHGERCCAALGHPERAFPPCIVAGTNGKGSVTAMTDDRAARRRVTASARYTSPHLVSVSRSASSSTAARWRRPMRCDARSRAVQQRRRARWSPTATLPGAADVLRVRDGRSPSMLFREAGVDVAVLEVGLGGRLDATNIVSPIVAGHRLDRLRSRGAARSRR